MKVLINTGLPRMLLLPLAYIDKHNSIFTHKKHCRVSLLLNIKPILNYSIFDRITKKTNFESYEKLHTPLLLLLTTALWAQDNDRKRISTTGI
jgi:hypothetical protein